MYQKSVRHENDQGHGGAIQDKCSTISCPFKVSALICLMGDKPFMINTQRVQFGQKLYIGGREIGRLSEVLPDRIFVKNGVNTTRCYRIGDEDFSRITTIPPQHDPGSD